MAKFAATTSVPVERSRGEIEAVLARYGATHFGYITEPLGAQIAFKCQDRSIRFTMKLPAITEERFMYTNHKSAYNRKRVSGEKQHANWEQACRQKWRALLLAIKAKLEAVDAGIATFEEEFLAFIVDPSTGTTVYDSIRENIEQRYLGKENGPLLLTGPTA